MRAVVTAPHRVHAEQQLRTSKGKYWSLVWFPLGGLRFLSAVLLLHCPCDGQRRHDHGLSCGELDLEHLICGLGLHVGSVLRFFCALRTLSAGHSSGPGILWATSGSPIPTSLATSGKPIPTL